MNIDPYHGLGGTYSRDPMTGQRVPLIPATSLTPPSCLEPEPEPAPAPEPEPPAEPDDDL